ncbi:MAG: Gfo/Idh/MocA family oxidoreductase [Bacteroidales bacterium]
MLKIAVAGFGFMGVTHTINILKNKNLQLVAIVDVNPENIRKNLEEKAGNFSTGSIDQQMLSDVNIYKSLDDCLLQEQLDAVVISVHTNLHGQLTKKALNAGKHVFLEKPFCLDLEEGKEMIELARQNKLVLMIGHVVRFMPAYLKLKNWIENKDFGALKFLSMHRFSGLPAWGEWKDKQTAFGTSGGALFDLAIHDIDFASWVLGQPDSVQSTCLPGKLSKYDYVSAIWNYHSKDLKVKMEGGNTFHSTYPFQAGYTAVFERASILYSSSDENIKISTDTEIQLISAGDANQGFSGEMEYFVSCITENKIPDLCSPESALETIELCYKHQ